MYAFEMCGTACGSCDEECIDDPDWHKNGEPEKDCAWASRFTKRCTTIGADMRRGYEACRYACRTCDFDTTGESSSTAWTVTYRGARESCRAEVGAAISHCPDAFPEFETAVEDNPTCGFAAVGAGVGSLYTVMRLIDEGILEPSDVCLFEATERVGGRTYSLRYSDLNSKGSLVVDAGAYRTWPRFTPVTHAVITEYLGINVTCYDADEDPCERFIIVDGETGHNLGFTHYLEVMAERIISAGVRFFPWHHLKKIDHSDDLSLTLTFSNGATATVLPPAEEIGTTGGSLILNTPQRPLLDIFRASATSLGLTASDFDQAHAVGTAVVTKCYLYYERAWWIDLGLTSGDFSLSGDATNMQLQGRYHDGDIVCDDDDNCSGFLLATYSFDYGGVLAQYFRRFQRDRPEPVTIISSSTVEGEMFLQHAHDRLTEYHLYENPDPSYTPFEARQILENGDPPAFAILATWNTAVVGAGGGWHGYLNLDYVDTMPELLADKGIHIINEAFSKVQSWAEGSFQQADFVLENSYGIPRPWDFEGEEVPIHVAQTAAYTPEDCEADGGSSGGGSSGGGSSGGATTDDELSCFLGDTLITKILDDDSTVFVKLSQVKEGDKIVAAEGVPGIVTEVLIHPIFDTVSVAVYQSKYGEIVGTVSHPVLDSVKKEWIDFGHISNIEKRFVDQFYNLEIDGNSPGASSQHAYLLNDGLVASGLGDNVILNTRFPRQASWKRFAKEQAASE
eukprot:CAMPEP_0197301690 /NCGR_PEP_ID=MMETSP0890-20130614/50557_1 /TAXON_ID=44058 ORGANISM="Aureoumbra lagunensis, Strain CCMP1510" /NCGR_SAMPLE_ID=MMETSP0890 /ASSEMBLY_ACC=CAM_ASM_000533 /LENGTH=735 /DNA_ID=CAMNT_0042781059 /DNA_START=255 /DNA_END=2462 /DNA_ORIENTATION=+